MKNLLVVLIMSFAMSANASMNKNANKQAVGHENHKHAANEMCNFVPENNLWIPADQKGFATGITEEQFFEIVDSMEKIYAPIIKKAGGNLKLNKLWDDGTVNASAQQSGKTWIVNMYGGLARYKGMTYDGFALVMCHELGHHLAGFPKVPGLLTPSWASNEGQSDYYATMKCFREVYGKEDNESAIEGLEIPALVAEKCSEQHKSAADIALCKRGAMGGEVLAGVLASLGGSSMPKFDTPDSNRVTSTNDRHPKAQCRMDTYFAGALCGVSHTIDFGRDNAIDGACAEERGDTFAVRPRCWYKPKASN